MGGWLSVRLGDVCGFEKEQAIHADLPYVGLENIESGTGRFLGATNAVAVKSATFRFSPAHVLYGRLRPYLNKVLLPNFEGHCSTEIFPIKPGDSILRGYLFHWLSMDSTVKAIDATSTGARMPRANMNAVLDFEIPLPPLVEQRRIVSILDEVLDGLATARDNAEKNLQNARELFAGHLHTVFSQRATGWVTKTVQQWVDAGVLAKPQDGNHGEIHPTKADYVDVGVPFIMAADMMDGRVDTEGCRFISRAQASSLRIGFARAGDVLLSHKGTIGRVAILDTRGDYVVLTPQVTYYRSLDSDRLFNGFLYYCLLSPQFQAAMNRIAGAGSTRAYIGITKQLELQIALPPIDVQRDTAARLRQIEEASDRLCELYQAKIAALDELKEALLHQAFTGQLSSGRVIAGRAALLPQTSSLQFTAAIISLAHERHRQRQRDKTFGHVKQQKLLHLVEAIARVDLGRQPMKDAAGPNDFRHQLKVENWARQNNFYEVVQRDGGGYDFKRLSGFDKLLGDASQVLGASLDAIESVIDLLIPMDSQEAELFATVHAAWNNLLIDGVEPTDDAIVREARDTWHPDKLKIPEARFRQTIALIRSRDLVPDGRSKYVGGQTQLI